VRAKWTPWPGFIFAGVTRSGAAPAAVSPYRAEAAPLLFLQQKEFLTKATYQEVSLL
jgi:hypothetical protein